jgi:peptidoglycan hydrolase CwlO-like protein
MENTLHDDPRLEAVESLNRLQKEIDSTVKDFDFHASEMLRAEKKLKTLHDNLKLHKEIWT